MFNESELKVKVSTTADVSGIVATKDSFEQLDISASKTANAIQVALAKTQVSEKSATDESKSANQERAQAALREIASREKQVESAKKAAEGLKEVGKATKELSQLGREAGEVVGGLAQGGIGGLAQAGRAAGNIIKTFATGTLGTVFIPVVAAAAAGLAYLSKKAEDTEKEIAKAFKSHASAAELYQTRLALLTAASAKDFDAQVANINKLTKAYDEVTAAIDRAYERDKKLREANAGLDSAKVDTEEKKALASAKTPEQQAAVKQKFSDKRTATEIQGKFNEFNTVDLESIRHEQEAQKAQTEAAQDQRAISLRAQEAEGLAQEKLAQSNLVQRRVGRIGRGNNSPEDIAAVENAQKEALAAKDAAAVAKKQAEEASLKLDDLNKKLTETQVSGKDTRELNEINRNAYRESLVGKKVDIDAEAKKTATEIKAKTLEGNLSGTDVRKDIAPLKQQLAGQTGTSSLIGGLLDKDLRNRDHAPAQADQRASAGLQPAGIKISGADGKPTGGDGSITKDGETIKVSSASTVSDLKKVSTTMVDSAKDIAKATPVIVKAAAESRQAQAQYHSEVHAAFIATKAQFTSQQKQIDEVKRSIQAAKDHS